MGLKMFPLHCQRRDRSFWGRRGRVVDPTFDNRVFVILISLVTRVHVLSVGISDLLQNPSVSQPSLMGSVCWTYET